MNKIKVCASIPYIPWLSPCGHGTQCTVSVSSQGCDLGGNACKRYFWLKTPHISWIHLTCLCPATHLFCQQGWCSRGPGPPPSPPRAYLLFGNWSDNSNRTSCLVVNYFSAMGLTLVWHLPAASKHLTVEVRHGKISWISD